MKIAVTGASGFVGRHVLHALGRLDHLSVIATSRTAPGEPLPSNTRWVSHDLAEDADHYVVLGRPDALIHLAWGGLPNYRSRRHFEIELPLQYRFLNRMVLDGLGHLVVTGTCYEYGMQSGALAESDLARPDNPYAFAKVTLHRQLEFLRAEMPFELTWARLFYMWGDGQALTSLFPLLRAAAERGDANFAMSGGEQLRDYLPVEQVASHIVGLALAPVGGGLVNVCSGTPVSVRTLVDGWIAEHGWQIVPDRGRYPYPDYEPLAFWGNARKLAGQQ